MKTIARNIFQLFLNIISTVNEEALWNRELCKGEVKNECLEPDSLALNLVSVTHYLGDLRGAV